MQASTTKTWAKRATLVGLVLFAGTVLAVMLELREAFAVIASEDAATKAHRLADALMKAERIKSVTRFTSPLGLLLFFGGLGTLVVLKFRGSRGAQPSDEEPPGSS